MAANDPPRPAKIVHVDVRHGEEVLDEYHWMRERDDPRVLAHLQAENAYVREVMRHTEPLQQLLYDEMVARIRETDRSVPVPFGDFEYFTRTEEGRQYAIHCRRRPGEDGDGQVLLDVNDLAEGHAYCRVGALALSPDHRLLAYALDTEGGERYTIRIKDLETGELLADEIPETYDSLAWADARTLFYTTLDAAHRPWRLYRHRLGGDAAEDALVHEEADDAFFVAVRKTRSQGYLLLELTSNTTTEVRFLSVADPEGEFRCVRPRRHRLEYYVEHHGERFFIVTNDGARNFRLLAAPVGDPEHGDWDEVVPHRPQVYLERVEAFERHLVALERADGLRRIRVTDLGSGETHDVAFSEPTYGVQLEGNREFRTNRLRFVYTSPVTPESVFDYDMDTRQRELRKEQPVEGGYDRSLYRTERIRAVAPDGTRVPISMVYRGEVDGPRPLVLNGYGSYGTCSDAAFSSARLSLLDRGFVFAIAHVRGGGELGRPWYESGKLLEKRNTFTDFIACAEHLIESGYTASERLAIRGGSAGGLLVGAATHLRPELFRAVLAKVPFVDVVNTMFDPSIPLTVIEWEEWGDPRQKQYYDYMRSYSPYDNVRPGRYPHMLITTGLSDPRVQYWEPAKWAARIREANRGDGVVLLKTNLDAGHSGASGRYDFLREVAFDYAFVIDRLGVEPGKPGAN